MDSRSKSIRLSLLRDTSKRIAVRWSRQAGKTTCIALRAIWFACVYPKTLTLIVAPTLRQSMIMSDRIQDFLANLPPEKREALLDKMQRTTIRFKNGSKIVALPNSPQLLRGYTANQVICFPINVKVLLADESERPISTIISGDIVLSYNVRNQKLEAKRVLKVFRRKYNGPLLRISHELGILECTPDHRLYTVRGKIPARDLYTTDEVMLARCNLASRETLNSTSRTVGLRKPFGGCFPIKNTEKPQKLQLPRSSFLETSRVCNVEVLYPSRLRSYPTEDNTESRMGQRDYSLLDTCLPSLYRSHEDLLQEWPKVPQQGMVIKDNTSKFLSHMVYGRWKSICKFDYDYQYAFLQFRRAQNSSEMAYPNMGNCPRYKKGLQRKRLLPTLSSGRKGQIFQSCEAVYSSEYALQNPVTNSPADMPRLWEGIQSQKTDFQDSTDQRMAFILFLEMLQTCTTEKVLQSSTNCLQDLWKNVYPTYWKSGYLQQRVQSQLPSYEEEAIEQSLSAAKEIEVFNIEVEDNHNYFANGVLVANCDESAFFKDDKLVFYNVLYPMLSTTDGTLIASSTPWSKDSVFYRLCQSPEFSQHTVTCEDVVASGLCKQSFIEEMRSQLPFERFQREFMANSLKTPTHG